MPTNNIHVLPINQTLDYINTNNCCVARFGDGEIDIINGHGIAYQNYDPELSRRLLEVLQIPSSPELLVCLSDVFEHLERYNDFCTNLWKGHLERYDQFYKDNVHNEFYGSTFLSRPYIDLADKSPAKESFAKLKQMWDKKDLLIVEGSLSKSGVGNDLFENANSIQRIICPSKNAYEKYDDILAEIKKYGKDKLIFIMLGPTAKVLTYDLCKEGYHAIDLGHINTEYEWFLMGATYKTKLKNKHTAEFNFDEDIEDQFDEAYESQIISRVE